MKMTVDLCCFKFFNRDKKKVEEDKNGENSNQNCHTNENNVGADQNGHAKSNGISSRITCSNFDNDRPMSVQPISQQNKRTSIGQVRKKILCLHEDKNSNRDFFYEIRRLLLE